MNILYVTSEATPFIKTGGLADVAGSLPKAIKRKGEDIRVVLPLYSKIDKKFRDKMEFVGYYYVDIAWMHRYCGVFKLEYDGVIFYFLDNESYFKRDNLYGEFDDAERFIFFSKAVVVLPKYLDFQCDVIHANDWHSGLVPIYVNKLQFMGSEIGTFEEWNEDKELSWSVLQYDQHIYLKNFVKDLNKLYKSESPLYEIDDSYDGFEWIEHENHDENIIAFERIDDKQNKILCFFNFSPITRNEYSFGVDESGRYKIILNSSHKKYGGPTNRNKPLYTKDISKNNRDYSIDVDLPPYAAIYVKKVK